MKKLVWLLTLLLCSNLCVADPVVLEGFVVEKIMDRMDGQTPRLEAIRNSEYGAGVVAASVDSGILTVLKLSEGGVSIIGTYSGFPIPSQSRTIRFDTTGLFENKLYISVARNTASSHGQGGDSTDILRVNNDGIVEIVSSEGSQSDQTAFIFEFSSGNNGYIPGIYLEDTDGSDGTKLAYCDHNYALTILSPDSEPSGRVDLDIWGMEFDTTGRYGNLLTMVDSDGNDDKKSVIYQLLPDLTWQSLTTMVSTSTRFYKDITFSNSGSFGQQLYVTEQVTDSVMTVDPDGIHDEFVSNFNEIESITIDDTGDFMYVSDYDGIWRVRAGTSEIGPQIVMQEPKVASDGVFTDHSGASSLRLLWNEPVTFTNDDVEILNELGQSISLSVSGSNSQFMIIAFGETLLNDKYTITISDSVVSAETGNPIDGDEDGLSGGDAIIVMEHRQRHDSDNDNDIDLVDLSELAKKWLWQE